MLLQRGKALPPLANLNYRSEIRFTNKEDLCMSFEREKLNAQKAIGHSLADETIFPEDDARRLNNLLQPSRYPAKV